MSTARLSPAMRNMLRAAIDGKPIANGETRAALIARSMLTDAGQPTDSGRAVFAPIIDCEEHRPGVTAVFDKIKREHPEWSDLKAAKEAKKAYVDKGAAC